VTCRSYDEQLESTEAVKSDCFMVEVDGVEDR
jgi:hypothetical protein